MKTKRSVKKRITNITPNNKYKCSHAYRSHLATGKSKKQRNHLQKSSFLREANKKTLKYALGGTR